MLSASKKDYLCVIISTFYRSNYTLACLPLWRLWPKGEIAQILTAALSTQRCYLLRTAVEPGKSGDQLTLNRPFCDKVLLFYYRVLVLRNHWGIWRILRCLMHAFSISLRETIFDCCTEGNIFLRWLVFGFSERLYTLGFDGDSLFFLRIFDLILVIGLLGKRNCYFTLEFGETIGGELRERCRAKHR